MGFARYRASRAEPTHTGKALVAITLTWR